jgi:thioredoxin-like negative regulator of GroEL
MSAGVTIVAALPTNTPSRGRMLDLRVESSGAPLKELRGLLKVQEAYAHAANGEELLSRGEVDRGRKEFSKAIALAPESSEIKLLFALGMMRQGEIKEAQSMLKGALGRGRDTKAVLRDLASRVIIREPASPRDSASQT